MCIIAFKPENIILDEQAIRNCFASNPDGAGFLVWDSKNNKLICQKGFFSVEELIDALKPFQNNRAVVHFRFGTSGKKDITNCYPFLINENLGFVHNGIIKIKCSNQEFSDTYTFNLCIKKYLRNNPNAWEINRLVSFLDKNRKMIQCGKFVFMDNFGNYFIYNEKSGVWDKNGCWFSNSNYLYSVDDWKLDDWKFLEINCL